MKSQDIMKALNIVFINWIIPSRKIKLHALKKLQRFCRRGSGAHAHFSMICKKVEFDNMFGPPSLYRQVCGCPYGFCDKIPIRIYNKHKRMKYAFRKIFGLSTGDSDSEEESEENIVDVCNMITQNEKIMNKYFTSIEHCYCNNKPISCYKSMVFNPRNNFNSLDGIRYIMCELSGDELTYYTRFKLSKFLSDRLK